ncbi:uncharacterized protein [Palaemon carinicauda]|uniref:uncharacterized protein n=1 Tax=Palaemon carinicauda TaxID=392227 RepID=UPI0035B58342
MSNKMASRLRRFTHPNAMDTHEKILKTLACIQRQDDDTDSEEDSEVVTPSEDSCGYLSVCKNSTFHSRKSKFLSAKEETWLGVKEGPTSRSSGSAYSSYGLQKAFSAIRRPLDERPQRQRSPTKKHDDRRSRSSERTRSRSKENSCLRGRRFTIISLSSPFSKFTDRSPDSSSYSMSSDGSSEGGSRCSHFRRALSLFSVSSEKEMQFFQKEKKKETTTRLLRPPTRYVYRRGVSGLPVTYSSSVLGIVF